MHKYVFNSYECFDNPKSISLSELYPEVRNIEMVSGVRNPEKLLDLYLRLVSNGRQGKVAAAFCREVGIDISKLSTEEEMAENFVEWVSTWSPPLEFDMRKGNYDKINESDESEIMNDSMEMDDDFYIGETDTDLAFSRLDRKFVEKVQQTKTPYQDAFHRLNSAIENGRSVFKRETVPEYGDMMSSQIQYTRDLMTFQDKEYEESLRIDTMKEKERMQQEQEMALQEKKRLEEEQESAKAIEQFNTMDRKRKSELFASMFETKFKKHN